MKNSNIILLFCVFAFCFSQKSIAQFSGNGSGTEEDPYQITSEDDLFDVRNNLSAHYIMMNDLDLTEWIAEESPKQGWDPISTFTGVFDGNGYTIYGLTISRSSLSNIGLFGSSSNATIKNICLNHPSVSGNGDVGSLVGKATNTLLFNITLVSPSVSGSAANVGSLAGSFTGTIDGKIKIVDADVKGESVVGGMIGMTSSCNTIEKIEIINPHVSGGDKTGGLIGSASYQNINNVQIINPSVIGRNYTGGIIGFWELDKYDDKYVYLMNNNIILGGKIEGNCYIGGIIGFIESWGTPHQREHIINNNYISSRIYGDYAAGVCGRQHAYSINKTGVDQSWIEYVKPHISFNRFDGNIKGNRIGGIAGLSIIENPATGSFLKFDGEFTQNIVTGKFEGQSIANGLFAEIKQTSVVS